MYAEDFETQSLEHGVDAVLNGDSIKEKMNNSEFD